MIIITLPTDPLGTNAYLVGCPETLECAIIDPGWKLISHLENQLKANKLVLTKILLTHSHWDHIGSAAELQERFRIPILIHEADAPNLSQPGADGLPCFIPIKGTHPDFLIDETSKISVGKLEFKVIHTPGHSPGGICFFCEKEKVLFSGDTLFQGSIGNISFPTSNPEEMWKSLKKLEILPKETKVYPGHGKPTTIAEEAWLPKAREIFE